MEIEIQSGDITRVKTDALITAINSGGMWFGGIDGVIQRVVGNLFHRQAQQAMPLTDGQTVVADHGSAAHTAAFANVVFVVDDLKRPLRDIIYAGLKAASNAGYKSVSLPTIRMGVMLGAVEKSKQEAVSEMAEGVRKFRDERSYGLDQITFVVYGDSETESLLRRALA